VCVCGGGNQRVREEMTSRAGGRRSVVNAAMTGFVCGFCSPTDPAEALLLVDQSACQSAGWRREREVQQQKCFLRGFGEHHPSSLCLHMMLFSCLLSGVMKAELQKVKVSPSGEGRLELLVVVPRIVLVSITGER